MRWVCFLLMSVLTAWAGTVLADEYPGVVPSLTEAQYVQLATADDTRPPDEPAWYGLLANVASWPTPDADSTEAAGPVALSKETSGDGAVPDYTALLDEPAAHRGELKVVEGRFAGRQRRLRVLRDGPWGQALTEWGVVVDPAAGGGRERVAVVYLVDPNGRQATPRENQRVQVLTRFYKLWQDVDADGQATTYPVFVGRYAALIEPEAAARRGMFRDLLVAAIVVLMVSLLGVRWWARRLGATRRRRREAWQRSPMADEMDADDEVVLPSDPAEALAALDDEPANSGDAERGHA